MTANETAIQFNNKSEITDITSIFTRIAFTTVRIKRIRRKYYFENIFAIYGLSACFFLSHKFVKVNFLHCRRLLRKVDVNIFGEAVV